MKSFENFINNPSMSDISFRIGNSKIYAHKFLLGAKSDMFRSMLYGDLWESKASEIKLEDPQLTEEMFLNILEFCYTGSTDIDQNTIMPILYLARFYQIKDLIEICNDYIGKNMCASTAVQILDGVLHMDDKNLIENCLSFIASNTETCLLDERALSWGDEAIKNLLDQPCLSIEELKLFFFLKDWVSNQPSNSDNSSLFSLIRYATIPALDLVQKVKPTKLAPTELYTEALEYNISPDLFDSTQTRFKKRSQNITLKEKTHDFDGKGALSWLNRNGNTLVIERLPAMYYIPNLSEENERFNTNFSKILGGHIEEYTLCTPRNGLRYFIIDLKKYQLLVNKCTLKCCYRPKNCNYSPQVLCGSNNGIIWDVIYQSNGGFQDSTCTWEIKTKKYYKYFKLSRNDDSQTLLSGWEMYGDLKSI